MTAEDGIETDSKKDIESTVFKQSNQKKKSSKHSQVNQVKEENRILKQTISQLRNEINKYKSPALMVAETVEQIKNDKAVIKVSNGNKFLVNMSNNVEEIQPGESVLVEQKNLTVVDKLEGDRKYNVEKFVIMENPQVDWKDVGGVRDKVNEVKEVIEMPMNQPETFKEVGIEPPKGLLLHGPPGTGKTLIAKAVASSTNSTFIEIVGSELVQKFIGEGAKFVKEVFEMAREKSPSIVFIDELDALAAKRVDIGTSGEREVQRTFMQLLAELDGFDPLGDVKVIGCTNRKDVLDPAVLRPGRFDRQIKVPHPSKKGVKEIFEIHSEDMPMEEVNLDKICKKLKGMSGAEIKAVCTEAGYFAIRDDRKKVQEKDIFNAVNKVKQAEEDESDYLYMFG